MKNNSTYFDSLTWNCSSMQLYFVHIPRDYHYKNILQGFILINALVAVLAICCNLIVIYTISRTPSLQKPSYFLILGLAVSDFGVGLLSQPTYAVNKFAELTGRVTVFCITGKVFSSTAIIFTVISFFTLSAITSDRFLAVQLHLRYQEVVTTKRCFAVIALIWISGLLISLGRMLALGLPFLITVIIIFISLLLLNAFFLGKIYQVIRRHSVQIRAQQHSAQQAFDMRKFRKTINTVDFIILAFLLCYVPYAGALIILVVRQQRTEGIRLLLTVTESFVMFNGVLNPIIYCLRIQEIRNIVRRFYGKFSEQQNLEQ
ncbi:melanocyte-stimulating hormone receptor-like [Actinia tenebrosa]|uniref:Melanocyte-stimulating hormone receptor-like n=1 Tax=Actinia tenebrosa TaxID=6105 RepID=A0A6P8H170_ACTTE|nr:melanocyte-stimulating hormone receptor-like [Actinia tenebrosa]